MTVDIQTLFGFRDNPAELAGYGPIPAPLARMLAADGKWRLLVCDPLTGALLDLGTRSYSPSAAMERFIRSRDARCAFPGCGQPAHRCDIDHTNPYNRDDPKTGTDRCNLGALCQGHHRLKHEAGWRLRRDPDNHTGTWTSPTGHEYATEHHDYRPTTGRPQPDEPISDDRTLDEAALRAARLKRPGEGWSYVGPATEPAYEWDTFNWDEYDPGEAPERTGRDILIEREWAALDALRFADLDAKATAAAAKTAAAKTAAESIDNCPF